MSSIRWTWFPWLLFSSNLLIGLVLFSFNMSEYSSFASFSMQVLDMVNNPHYLYRMTVLQAISLLAPVMGSEITCSKLLPVIVTASKDR